MGRHDAHGSVHIRAGSAFPWAGGFFLLAVFLLGSNCSGPLSTRSCRGSGKDAADFTFWYFHLIPDQGGKAYLCSLMGSHFALNPDKYEHARFQACCNQNHLTNYDSSIISVQGCHIIPRRSGKSPIDILGPECILRYGITVFENEGQFLMDAYCDSIMDYPRRKARPPRCTFDVMMQCDPSIPLQDKICIAQNAIKSGMQASSLLHIIGKPDRYTSTTLNGKPYRRWIYTNPAIRQRFGELEFVLDENDKVLIIIKK